MLISSCDRDPRLTDATGYVEVLARAVQNPNTGVNLAFQKSFNSGDSAGAREAVRGLAQSGANVFVCLVFDNDMEPMLDEAHRLGLLTAEYSWVSADTVTTSTPFAAGANAATIAERLDGFLVYQASPSISSGYARLSQVWATVRHARDPERPLATSCDSRDSTGLHRALMGCHAVTRDPIGPQNAPMAVHWTEWDPTGVVRWDAVPPRS